MPALATAKPDAVNAHSNLVTAAIGEISSKLRLQELLFGIGALAAWGLAYLAIVMLLDRWLQLPDWVRQLGFVGSLGIAAVIAYGWIVRPLQRRLNPRFIARRVEATIPDAKNALINWIDLQERDLPASVKTAMNARAAAGVREADLERAAPSRWLAAIGVGIGVLIATLAVLFLVFKSTQFLSLAQRAINPFASGEIATQTRIELVEPIAGDASVVDGEPFRIAATILGRVPAVGSPEQPRLLVRYSQDDPATVELPLLVADGPRDWALDVPRNAILNGFWYRIAAGDAETPEYRVSVRTRPACTGFAAIYDYPAYLQWPKSEAAGPNLRAIRGTKATYTVTTNREVRSGSMHLKTERGSEAIRGTVAGEKKDSLRFEFEFRDTGVYYLSFVPNTAERETSTVEYPILVDLDGAPKVELRDPEAVDPKQPASVPIDGLLTVDGTVEDDFGLATATLRLEVVGKDRRKLAPVPLRDRKSFLRGDGTPQTWPPVEIKESVKLDSLRDDKGQPVKLAPGESIEYWLEATDTCTVPEANIGTSQRKSVRLVEAPKEPEAKQKQKQNEADRKNAEAKQRDRQNKERNDSKRPDAEKRDPNNQAQPSEKEPKPEENDGGEKKPNEPAKQGEGDSDQKPGAGDKNEADKVENKLKEKQERAGDAKGDGDKDGEATAPNAESKKPDGSEGGDKSGESKPAEAKEGDKNGDAPKEASEGKDPGRVKDTERSEEKQAPKDGSKPDQQPGDGKAKGDEKTNPGDAKDSKPSEEQKPNADGSQPKDDGKQASEAKGDKPSEANKAKPKGEPDRAGEKQAGEKGDLADSKPEKSSDAKGDKPGDKSEAKDKPEPGATESDPKKGPPPDAGEQKSAPQEPMNGDEKGQPGEGKSEGKKPQEGDPMGQASSEKGTSKEVPKPGEKKAPPQDAEPGELDREIGDLDSSDPKKQEEAKKKLDEKLGKEKREEIERLLRDRKRGTPEQKQQADKDLDELKKQEKDKQESGNDQGDKSEGKPMGNGKPTAEQKKELEENMKKLDSKDEAERKAAEQKMDELVGEKKRKDMQQAQKDAASDDPKTKKDGEEKLEELAKNAQKQAGEKGNEPTAEQKKELEENLKKLNSKDEAERKAAEKKIDDLVGKEQREAAQQLQKDLESSDPMTREAAKKKLEDLAKQAENRLGGKEQNRDDARLGGGNLDKPGKTLEENAANRLKTDELRLKQFKELRGKKDFLKDLGYTPEQYEEFLKREENRIEQLRDDVANNRSVDPSTAEPTLGRNDFTGDRIKGGTATGSVNGAGGAKKAPPGFAEAQKRFAAEAAKKPGTK